ncbi:MAG: hypothetical protein M0D55_00780 [Elusimicrobiota bacterium]|nr:MAG: hypothetical protein M0D55_00780 [Elusimicrobiota bacterium]
MGRLPLFLIWLLAAAPAAAGVTSVPETFEVKPAGNSAAGASGSVSPLGGTPVPVLSPALAAMPSPSAGPAPAPVQAAAVAAKAAAQPAAAKALPPETRRIVFDVRGSRGGHGDVAAAYLTAYDLLDRTAGRSDAITPSITFIAGDAERKILSRLTGRTVRSGDDLFDGQVKVYAHGLPKSEPEPDVLMNLAAPDGEYKRPLPGDEKYGLRLAKNTVILTQTVFGNTESEAKGPATMMINGRRLELSNAGLATADAGVYADPVARALRRMTPEQRKQFALDRLEEADVPGSAAAGAVVRGEVLAGAEIGLAYGISMKEVKPQFEQYLSGLAARLDKTKGSYVIVTPSAFKVSDVKDVFLRGRIQVIEGDPVLPEKAEKGKIYVLKTGTLPHPAFVSLMALSRPPPVVAGDGAMSAAIGLGRPFVLTRVGWNEDNIEAYARRLYLRTPPKDRPIVKEVFEKGRLQYALGLETVAPAFDQTSRAIPLLTDTMFAAIQAARDVEASEVPTSALLAEIQDPKLKASLLSVRSVLGDFDAQELAGEALYGGDKKARRITASALAREVLGGAFIMRHLVALDFHPINMLAARFALRWTRAAARRDRGG